jgi:hypothetical protein
VQIVESASRLLWLGSGPGILFQSKIFETKQLNTIHPAFPAVPRTFEAARQKSKKTLSARCPRSSQCGLRGPESSLWGTSSAIFLKKTKIFQTKQLSADLSAILTPEPARLKL